MVTHHETLTLMVRSEYQQLSENGLRYKLIALVQLPLEQQRVIEPSSCHRQFASCSTSLVLNWSAIGYIPHLTSLVRGEQCRFSLIKAISTDVQPR